MAGKSPYLNAVHMDGAPEMVGRIVEARIREARPNSLAAEAVAVVA